MSTYRLDPINLIDRRWQASSIKETVWAGADNPNEARQIVAAKTLVAIRADLGAPKPLSPWLDDHLSMCALETSRTDIPKGTLITAPGK